MIAMDEQQPEQLTDRVNALPNAKQRQEQFQRALEMYTSGSKSIAEIAKAVGIPRSTLQGMLSRLPNADALKRQRQEHIRPRSAYRTHHSHRDEPSDGNTSDAQPSE
jgi:predicted ArsR family transcriptional regulator